MYVLLILNKYNFNTFNIDLIENIAITPTTSATVIANRFRL